MSAAWLARFSDRPGLVNVYAERSHLVAYRIPGAEGPVLNWMWYRNVDASDLAAFMTDREGCPRRYSLPGGLLPPARRRILLQELHAQMPKGVFEAAEASAELSLQAIYRGVPARWQRGRVVLIGDAAHTAVPHIGAGVSLALADARSLGDVMREQPQQGAVARWAQQRRAVVSAVLAVSARLGAELQSTRGDWERWPPCDFARFWQQVIGDGQLYFEQLPASGPSR